MRGLSTPVCTVALVACALLASCAPPETEQQAIERERAEAAGQVVARIDGEPLTLGEFEATVDEQPVFVRRTLRGETARLRHFAQWLDFRLLVGEAHERDLATDPAVQQVVREQLARLFWADPGLWSTARELSDAEVEAWFEAHRDDYREPPRIDLIAVHRPGEASAERLTLASTMASAALRGAGHGEVSALAILEAVASASGVDEASRVEGPIGAVTAAADDPMAERLAALYEAASSAPVPSAAPRVVALADGTAFVYMSRERLAAGEPSLRKVRNRVVQDLLAARAVEERQRKARRWLREANVRILDPRYRELTDLLAGAPDDVQP